MRASCICTGLMVAGLAAVWSAGEGRAVEPFEPSMSDPVLEPWRWQAFKELKGLGLRCMAEDRDGHMWFGVDEGVRRYDGLRWTGYTPEDGLYGAPVARLAAARDGGVYAGTELGVSRFLDGAWRRVFPPEGHPYGGSGQVLPWYIYDLQEAGDGSVWAGTAWGALHLGAEAAVLYTTEQMGAAVGALAPYVRVSIVPEAAAPVRPWPEGIGVRAHPAWYFYDAERCAPVIWGLAPGGAGEAAGLRVGDRIESVDGQTRGMAERLDGAAGSRVRVRVRREGRAEAYEVTVTRGKVEGGFRDFWVYDVCEGRLGAVWLGLSSFPEGGEVVCFDVRGAQGAGAWRLYGAGDGLDAGFRQRMLQGQDGAMWAVSDATGHGVNRFDGVSWTSVRLSREGGYDINPSVLQTRDGVLWVGGHWGYLHACREGVWTVYRAPEVPVPRTRVVDLVEASDGALWVAGMGQEALRVDLGTGRWSTYEGLNYQCEGVEGAQWFLWGGRGVVLRAGGEWRRYGLEDGLMDLPLGVLCAGEGAVWAWGSHGGMAATARFEGRSWSLKTHPRLSWAAAAGYAALDGSVWFGAAVNWRREEGHVGGVVRYDGQTWRHDRPPDAPEYVYGSGQTADGRMWFGGRDLRWFDGSSWTAVASPEGLASRYCDAVHAGRNGELWVGHRSNGAFCFDGRTWRRYDVRDGLADNHVRAIVEAGDGGVWAATPEGVSRFDPSAGAGQAQRAWVTQALPPGLEAHVVGGGLRQGGDGALWINYFESGQGRPPRVWTVRYGPDARPPETEITLSVDEVSQPGNTTLAWMGADAWRTTVGEELEYAWRLDGGAWSAFTRQRSRIFQSLSSGRHRFEVKARDRDFTEDPTPAVVEFTVVPPVWRQPWFVGLVLAFSGVTAFQGSRIVVRDRKLKEANTALSAANRELFAVNSELENEIAEREQAECERAVLDVRLQQLRYLYRLREALGDARTPDEAVRAAGGLVMEALSAAGWGGLCVRQNGREWRFGDVVEDGRLPSYERPIAWGGKRWGTFRLQCGVALSEAQERALVDETAGQIAHVLEARELEMQLLNSARLVSMGQMTAGVAHELGQPMTVIAARAGDVRCRLMQDLDLPDEKLKEMMEDVLDMVDRMDGMVDHMRVFSRDTSQEPRVPFSLNEAVRAGLKMVGAQLGNHGIEVALDLAEGLPRVCGHSNRMEQVVLNLLNNARDALDEKKAGDRALRKRLCVRTRPGDDGVREVVLEVEDNGIGMDAAAVERAVEPFYTTKDASRGTGLGLSISYAIVQSHGGRISCESREGEGTTFRVVLPAVDGG